MGNSRTELQIEIFGNTYNIISGVEDIEYNKNIAKYLDQKMKEVSSKTSGNISSNKIAILSALNITDELFKAKKDLEKTEEEINQKTGHLIELIEKEIAG